MNLKNLKDEELLFLHRKKKADVVFILSERYKNYCYSIIYKTLHNSNYFNALVEEKDSLMFEAIIKSIKTFNGGKGVFRSYLAFILKNIVVSRIREFAQDPISDYVSVDNKIDENTSLLDTLIFADSNASPRELIDLKERVNSVAVAIKSIKYKQIIKMLEMREQGYSYNDIGKKFKMSAKVVRSIFINLKTIVNKSFR